MKYLKRQYISIESKDVRFDIRRKKKKKKNRGGGREHICLLGLTNKVVEERKENRINGLIDAE